MVSGQGSTKDRTGTSTSGAETGAITEEMLLPDIAAAEVKTYPIDSRIRVSYIRLSEHISTYP
jgi:hypothetical protein